MENLGNSFRRLTDKSKGSKKKGVPRKAGCATSAFTLLLGAFLAVAISSVCALRLPVLGTSVCKHLGFLERSVGLVYCVAGLICVVGLLLLIGVLTGWRWLLVPWLAIAVVYAVAVALAAGVAVVSCVVIGLYRLIVIPLFIALNFAAPPVWGMGVVWSLHKNLRKAAKEEEIEL